MVNVRAPAGGLLHPLALIALLVMMTNDHVFKDAWPGVLTGKISDLAGLVFFPLFLQALWETSLAEMGRDWQPRRAILLRAVLATAIGFVLVKTVPACHDAYRYGLGFLQWPARILVAEWRGVGPAEFAPVRSVLDPTDLVALPGLLLALRAGWYRGDPELVGGAEAGNDAA